MFFGRNEDCALRCVYHGWAFDREGNTVDMPSEPPTSNFKDKVKILAYPVHESGGIVWTYMGPKESMTPFRDFGTESLPKEHVFAAKLHSTCNWVQAMEGNLDTSHISWLHQFNGIDDIPDDGSDKPGYPSNAMSWKFWRHDRHPRLEVQDTWYGYRYAGIRITPNGHTHVRITDYCLPYTTVVASNPFTTRQGMFVPIDDTSCWRYFINVQDDPNPQGYGGDNLFAVAPFTTPTLGGPNGGITPREYTAENDYRIDREVQKTATFSGVADFVSQDLMVTEYCIPYTTVVASNPFTTRQSMFVPIDDENCWRYAFTTQVPSNPRNYGGDNLFAVAPFTSAAKNPVAGITPREYTAENDYRIDREVQKTSTFSGVADFTSQDLMVTESMGGIYDRSKENLGTTDRAIIRMRNILLRAARDLAEGKEPPALAGTGDFRTIRSAEKILEEGEDWRILGTDDDPVVQEAVLAHLPTGGSANEALPAIE